MATKSATSKLARDLGRHLQAARERAGESRRGMAARIGVSDPTLHIYENGQANPTLSKVEELAGQYGLEVVITVRKKRP